MKLVFVLIIFVVFCNSAYSKLPLCKDGNYSNCYGSYSYQMEGYLYTYTGEFGNTNEIKEGQGETKIYLTNNALVHHEIGEYKNNYLNGVGTRIIYDIDGWSNGYIYKGEFKSGFIHGKGVKQRGGTCGYKYSGEFRKDLYHGIGTLSETCPNGRGGINRTYTGEFKYNFFHGQGTEIWSNGVKYTGEFKDDRRHGRGELHGLGYKYIGQFEMGTRDGEGVLTFDNGDKYDGQFRDEKYHGYGTYTWIDGSWYAGEWKKGSRNGIGTLKLSDGTVREGTFKNDVLIEVKITKENNKLIDCYKANGLKYFRKKIKGCEEGDTTYYLKPEKLTANELIILRQQLISCWNAPAGAIINAGNKVKVFAKVNQNAFVLEDSIELIDTNIAKTSPFYEPITDSAMRTLLNPECRPLKLPKDKYQLWKNLTITFDYSIMTGNILNF